MNFEAILAVLFLSPMTLLVTMQVILQLISKIGLSWGEEMARLLFVWISFSGLSYLIRGNRHVRVGLFRELFPVWTQKAILTLCDVLSLILSTGGLGAIVQLCSGAQRFQGMLTAAPWNYNALYPAGMLGFFMMVVRNIQILVWRLRHWGDDLERFANHDGDYYESNRTYFKPKIKDVLELTERKVAELLEEGE